MTIFRKICRKRITKVKLLVVDMLYDMTRERNKLTTASLVDPSKSAWAKLYEEKVDAAFINITSLDVVSFEALLQEFSKHYQVAWNLGKGGRPCKLVEKHQVLGLLLAFYCDSGSHKSLCLTFGVPPSTLSDNLSKAEVALDLSLLQLHEARIVWPTLQQQVEWGRMVQTKYRLLYGRWGWIDGKNHKVQQPSNAELQNAMYNGWLHSTLVTGVFCFAVDGCICWGRHNCVGSWNDGDMSRTFQWKLCARPRPTVTS